MGHVKKAGWTVNNADCTLIAEEPRISPHVAAMRANIAQDLGIEPDRIGIKATTNERMGFLGRREGIAAIAVVLLVRETENSDKPTTDD